MFINLTESLWKLILIRQTAYTNLLEQSFNKKTPFFWLSPLIPSLESPIVGTKMLRFFTPFRLFRLISLLKCCGWGVVASWGISGTVVLGKTDVSAVLKTWDQTVLTFPSITPSEGSLAGVLIWKEALKKFLEVALDFQTTLKQAAEKKTSSQEAMRFLSNDASFAMSFDVLVAGIQKTLSELEKQPPEVSFARHRFQSLLSFSSAAHSLRSPPTLPLPSLPTWLQTADPLQQAEWLCALRHFPEAMQALETFFFQTPILTQGLLDPPFRQWKRALDTLLALWIRTQGQPQAALTFVEKVITHPTAPYFIQQTALEWKGNLQQWLKEEPISGIVKNKKLTPLPDLRKKILSLMATARMQRKYPQDRSADVLYLRASLLAQELLERDQTGKFRTEAFLLAGICYQALGFPLPELYYEACIRESPHTPMAKTCYQHYEEWLHLSFTGSAGTLLPEDLGIKLKQQKGLAFPVETKPLPIF